MNGLHAGVLAVHGPAQMHEATVVESGAVLGFGGEHVLKFGGHHGGGDLGVFHRECSAEAAAAVHVGQGGKIKAAHPGHQFVGPLAELQRANTVATGVVDDAMGECCAHILYTQLVDEELAQLVDPGHESREVLAEGFVSQLFEEAGILIADHGHAGGGGNNDGLRVLVEADKALGLGESFAAKAGVGVHLAATSLPGMEIERHAQTLKQPHHGAAGLRKERVVIASDKKRSTHGCLEVSGTATKKAPLSYSIER